MIFVDKNGNLKSSSNEKEDALEACFQELLLWKGENPLDINSGVDYQGVFSGTLFLKTELERVCSYHKENFESIEVGDPRMDQEGIVQVTIYFVLFSKERVTRELILNIGNVS